MRDWFWVGGGVGLARALSLVIVVVLARHLPPAEFGLYSLGWGTWLIVSQIPTGIDLAFVDLQSRQPDGRSMSRAYWAMKLQVCAALAIVGSALAAAIAEPVGWNAGALSAAVIGVAGGAATAHFRTWLSALQASGDFRLYAYGSIALNLGIFIATMAVVFVGVTSPDALLVIYPTVSVALTGLAWSRERKSLPVSSPDARWRLMRHSRWLFLSSTLLSFGSRAELLVASALLIPGQFALYGAAARLFGLFQVALTTMGTVLLPRASRLGKGQRVRDYVAGSVAVTGIVGAGGLLLIWQAPLVTGILLGDTYREAASLVPALCVAAVFLAANSTLRFMLFSVGRPGAFALMNAILLVTKVAAAIALIPLWGPIGAAWATAISFAVGTVYLLAVVVMNRSRIGNVPAQAVPASTAGTGVS